MTYGIHDTEEASLRGIERAILRDLLEELGLDPGLCERYRVHHDGPHPVFEIITTDGGSLLVTLASD